MDVQRARVRLASEPAPRYVSFAGSPAHGDLVTVTVVEGRSEQAGIEAIVNVHVERCDAGRCAVCRDNARTRFVVKQSDAHGVKKWCDACLSEKLAIDPRSVPAGAS